MRLFAIIILSLLATACSSHIDGGTPHYDLSLMSYNVRSGKGLDNHRDLNRTAANRNGHYRALIATANNRLAVEIKIEKSQSPE